MGECGVESVSFFFFLWWTVIVTFLFLLLFYILIYASISRISLITTPEAHIYHIIFPSLLLFKNRTCLPIWPNDILLIPGLCYRQIVFLNTGCCWSYCCSYLKVSAGLACQLLKPWKYWQGVPYEPQESHWTWQQKSRIPLPWFHYSWGGHGIKEGGHDCTWWGPD